MSALKEFAAQFGRLWRHEIWQSASVRDKSPRGKFYASLRVASITLSGLKELKVAARAAALSYSSLLSLGPLLALAVLVAGFVIGDRDPAIVARGVNKVISFVAPQLTQYDRAMAIEREKVKEHDAVLQAAPPPGADKSRPVGPKDPAVVPAPDPELVQHINNFIVSSRSGAAGAIGLLSLLIIVIQLFTTIENTFNDIWGVRRGRSWLTRVVYYWTAITLGAVLFFTAITLLSAGAFINVFFEKIPLGDQLKAVFVWMLPSSSALMLTVILTLFYRSIPNTRVKWRAAIIGAMVVTALLLLNNTLAFLYFRNVVLNKSLYGSVGILFILMVGLYLFWFFVLVGGQLTYAVQNVHYRSSQAAWHHVNHHTREALSLLVLLLIARRFKGCQPPFSASELAGLIRVPAQILNESLNRLTDLQLVTQLPPADARDQTDYRFQPARPLERISLLEFKELFDHYGESPSGTMLDSVDPILAHYHSRLAEALPKALGDRSLDDLIDDMEPTLTAAPFPVRTKAV